MGSYSQRFTPGKDLSVFFRTTLNRPMRYNTLSSGASYGLKRRVIALTRRPLPIGDDVELIDKGLYFAAVHNTVRETGETFVDAYVCFYERTQSELYWRIDHEEMGPYSLCPASILDRLTPVWHWGSAEFAQDWREKSAAALGRVQDYSFWLGEQAA